MGLKVYWVASLFFMIEDLSSLSPLDAR